MENPAEAGFSHALMGPRLRRYEEAFDITARPHQPIWATTTASPCLTWLPRVAIFWGDRPASFRASTEKLGDAEAGSPGHLFHFRAHLMALTDTLFVNCGLNPRVQSIEILERHFLESTNSHFITLFCSCPSRRGTDRQKSRKKANDEPLSDACAITTLGSSKHARCNLGAAPYTLKDPRDVLAAHWSVEELYYGIEETR